MHTHGCAFYQLLKLHRSIVLGPGPGLRPFQFRPSVIQQFGNAFTISANSAGSTLPPLTIATSHSTRFSSATTVIVTGFDGSGAGATV